MKPYEEGDFIIMREKMLINRKDGIKGPTHDYGDYEEEGDMVIELALKIPRQLFEPIKIQVDIPPEAVPPTIPGEPVSVEVPLEGILNEVQEVRDEVKISSGFLGFLKRVFTVEVEKEE
jgi:hypothetical protein